MLWGNRVSHGFEPVWTRADAAVQMAQDGDAVRWFMLADIVTDLFVNLRLGRWRARMRDVHRVLCHKPETDDYLFQQLGDLVTLHP
jgi:hypothetical protein